MFADDAALVGQSDDDLHNLLNGFLNACDDFGLTTASSLQKTKITTQGTGVSSSLFIEDYALEMVNSFIYLGGIVTSTTFLDTRKGKRIGQSATNMSKLSQHSGKTRSSQIPPKWLSTEPASSVR